FIFDIVKAGNPVYGINTGFGALANKHVASKDLEELQYNLVRSHCTGVGRPFKKEIVRATMLMRINCLIQGYSGVNPEIVELLLDFINHDITPVVPEKGSVGASGDLAPLSHIALCLIGEGEVTYQGNVIDAQKAISAIGKKAIKLGPKDGLALINGTSVMCALGALAVTEARQLMKLADVVSCLTLDGIQGSKTPFRREIQELKPHRGQKECADNLIHILDGSEIIQSHVYCGKVQDPYSLRCIPQVHGACRQTLHHAQEVIDTEIGSVTDNPLVFVETKEVMSGGNFHGEALALCMDYLAMGLAEICSISERRIEKMMNPTFSELPAFLSKNSGLNSGLMIAQVTAAALTSENKYLAHPASVDSIPTSTDKEDHVSMGVTAGRKLHEIIFNVKNTLGIELLCAAQAMEFQRPKKSSPALEAVYYLIRQHVAPLENDRPLYKDMDKIVQLINRNEVVLAVEKILGELK
ncbi:MAG: histidine ammonia-lyase, partial [Pseudomonadota bacterium]